MMLSTIGNVTLVNRITNNAFSMKDNLNLDGVTVKKSIPNVDTKHPKKKAKI